MAAAGTAALFPSGIWCHSCGWSFCPPTASSPNSRSPLVADAFPCGLRECLALGFCLFFPPSTPVLTWPDCAIVIIPSWLHCRASQPLKHHAGIAGLGLNGRIKSVGDEWGESSCLRRWTDSPPRENGLESIKCQKNILFPGLSGFSLLLTHPSFSKGQKSLV